MLVRGSIHRKEVAKCKQPHPIENAKQREGHDSGGVDIVNARNLEGESERQHKTGERDEIVGLR
jgi:hypothetical protein